ncbi:MAG: Gfo/Idh/MocA family oxidoreductase [candidate division Zixibacteria bacterium]|nr:Gfo/Idh/MocA family oxidoreductase [candidate division Zixibacteria bacterium]
MNQNTYTVCVVGLTGIGAGKPLEHGPAGFGSIMPHAHLPAYAAISSTRVVGVCDLVRERVDDTLGLWSPIFPDLKGYTDFREMITECRPDLLSVVTSDNRHADIVVHAAENGVRGIYCEKPIATNLADADRMIDAVTRRNVPMTINHTRRWVPIFRQAKTLVEQGEIGDLRRITVSFGGPRAILFRNGTHIIDMTCFLAGSKPAWVFAELDEGYEDYWPYRGDGGRNADLEPGCSGFIHFENGVRAFYNGSKGTAARTGFELTGTKGWIFVDDDVMHVNAGSGVRIVAPEPRTESNAVAAVRELIHVVEHGGETISPPHAARITLEIILGFLASQKRGNVRIEFPLDETTV